MTRDKVHESINDCILEVILKTFVHDKNSGECLLHP